MKKQNRVVWVVPLALAAAAAWGFGPGGWFERAEATPVRGARVTRGPLRISVLQRGNLAAKNSVSIKSEIEGQTTVLYLVPEGTIVKPGDLLVELDSADLVEKRVAQEISFQNAEASYTKAKAAYEIQESQNASDIELAERKLQFAALDQEKYLEGDSEQLLKQAEDKILLAQQELTQAENTLTWSKTLFEKGFLTKSELDRDDLDYQSAKVKFEQAKVEKDLLREFDDPRQRTELEADRKEAERGLERAKLKATAMIADYEASLKSSESKLKLEQEKLTRYLDQLAKTRIVAPVTGMVVYTRGEPGRGGGGGEPVQEGSQIRERQEILTIPQTGGMIVEASLHESVLKQVAPGMPVTIQVDAIPGQQFEGKVQFVALLADKGSWWMNPNTRVYRSEISIAEPHPDMRPGMSCSIEILSEEIPDALYVPLQAVLLDAGETIAFVYGVEAPERRVVRVGRSNDKWVQVVQGLAENEEVLLTPPTGFMPKPSTGGERANGRPGAAARPDDAAATAARPDGPPSDGSVDGRARDGAGAQAGLERGPEGTEPAAGGERSRGGRRGGRPPGAAGEGGERAKRADDGARSGGTGPAGATEGAEPERPASEGSGGGGRSSGSGG